MRLQMLAVIMTSINSDNIPVVHDFAGFPHNKVEETINFALNLAQNHIDPMKWNRTKFYKMFKEQDELLIKKPNNESVSIVILGLNE